MEHFISIPQQLSAAQNSYDDSEFFPSKECPKTSQCESMRASVLVWVLLMA